MSVELRPMRPADVDPVAALERTLFPHDPWTAEQFREELAGVPETRWYAVAEDAGEVVGYAGLMVVAGTADIQTVAVAPVRQRRGIGRRLLAALAAEAVARRAAEVLLEVRADNEAALALYVDAGFERIARRRSYYAGPGGVRVDALVLRRRLPAGERPRDG